VAKVVVLTTSLLLMARVAVSDFIMMAETVFKRSLRFIHSGGGLIGFAGKFDGFV
jgi:hypothetical protein